MYMERILSSLSGGGYTVKFFGYSAIDKYMGISPLPFTWVETNADLSVLARHCENLEFPGVDIADGAVYTNDEACYFFCRDQGSGNTQAEQSNSLLSFRQDHGTGFFRDCLGIYPALRELRDRRSHYTDQDVLSPKTFPIEVNQEGTGFYKTIMDAALLLSRYGYKTQGLDLILENCEEDNIPEKEAQRNFLVCILLSPRPDWGLELVKKYGLLEAMWPELSAYDDVDHAKEFHPEGNVWKHTLETFRHRKAAAGGAFDLRLSLALLLHDAGKPISDAHSGKRFDGHAEIGARAAGRFLESLEFPRQLIQEIQYLVKNHMLPAALKRLPVTKTAEIMASPLFPTLMELYRCDESSSFKGLDSYYENSAAYKTYLKNARNPYRSLDGKKIGKKEIYQGKRPT